MSAPWHSRVEPRTGHGVAGDDHRVLTLVDPVADGRTDRGVVGRRRGDPHPALVEDDTLVDLGGHGGRRPGEVLVMGEPVADVRLQHGLGGPTSSPVPTGPTTVNGFGWNDVTHRVVTMSLRSVM